MFINLNGTVLQAEQPALMPFNRAFRYGDGLFESIRAIGGNMPFFDLHWQRLRAGMGILKFSVPPHFSPDFFLGETMKLIDGDGDWRIRITVYRSGGGLYTPDTDLPEFLITAERLSSDGFRLNEMGLSLGVFDEMSLPVPLPKEGQGLQACNLKTCCALPFVLAARFKKEKKLDDCLLLNTAGRIACGSSSNVFWVKNGGLHTPPLSEGCVAGTMRNVVIDLAKSLSINVLEKPLPPAELSGAEELFLTNAIQGIRWTACAAGVDREFGSRVSALLSAALADWAVGRGQAISRSGT